MPRKHPDKVTVPGNPPIVVTLVRRSLGKDNADTGNWFYRFWWKGTCHRGTTESEDKATAFAVATAEARDAMQSSPMRCAAMSLKAAIELMLKTRWPEVVYPAPSLPQPRVNGIFARQEGKSTKRDTSLWYENRSYATYRQNLMQFARHAGEDTTITTMSVDGATKLVQAFLDSKRHLKATTIYVLQRHLSTFHNFLRRRKFVSWMTNPATMDSLDMPQRVVGIKEPLTDAEIAAALKGAWSKEFFPHIVLVLSGMRFAGTTRTDWSDIDLQRRTVAVTEKNKRRTILLSAWAVEQLKRWKEKNPDHEFRHTWQMYKIAHRVSKLPGCERVNFQALRRAFLFRLYQNNVSPQMAAQLAGNSVATISKHYVDVSTLNATAAVNTIDFSRPAHGPTHKDGSNAASA